MPRPLHSIHRCVCVCVSTCFLLLSFIFSHGANTMNKLMKWNWVSLWVKHRWCQLTPGASHGCVSLFQQKTSALCHNWATDTYTHFAGSSAGRKNRKQRWSAGQCRGVSWIRPPANAPFLQRFPPRRLTFGFLAVSSSPCSSSMCRPSSGLLSTSVTDGDGAGLPLPWSQLQ